MATGDERLIAGPARARDDIGALAFHLEQTLQSLREVHDHVRDTSRTVPGVLHELRDIVRMTESATVRVLDETEALVEESKAAVGLLREAHALAGRGAAQAVGKPLGEVEALVERVNDRAAAIMSALEFQDVTSQKVQRAFGVLEEVCDRMARIRRLVDPGEEVAPAMPPPAALASDDDDKTAQEIADEILSGFERD